MSKEKQIEKMANVIKLSLDSLGCGNFNFTGEEISTMFAEALYNADYRKQEWISVDERLPTLEDGKVLIYTPYGISIAQKTTTNHWKGDNAIPKLITHWMPLPEAPKGGAE